jgi:RNA polymerase primary sigma factor
MKNNQKIYPYNDSFTLRKYFSEVSKYPVYDALEENQLILRLQKKDKLAEKQLTQSYLRFVIFIAMKYQNPGFNILDLINEGNLGLVKAIRSYKPYQNVSFRSYAGWWIRHYILKAANAKSNIIKVSKKDKQLINKINTKFRKLEQIHQHQPGDNELFGFSKISERKFRELMQMNRRHISFDAPLLQNERKSLLDKVQDENAPKADETLINKEKVESLEKIILNLPEKQRMVIEMYFGIHQNENTLAEIAKKMNVSRIRVKKLKNKALRRILRTSKNELLGL